MTKDEVFKKTEKRLFEYKNLKARIAAIELDILEQENEIEGCKGMDYSGVSTGNTYNISSGVENEIIKRERKIKELLYNKAKKEIEKKKIENGINFLDEQEFELFEKYYLCNRKANMTFVAMQMHIDRSHAYNIKREIVYKFIDIFYPIEEKVG